MIDDVHDTLENHEERIRGLEISDATMGQKIEHLTKSIEELIWWLKTIVIGACATGTGFIIWYIQKG